MRFPYAFIAFICLLVLSVAGVRATTWNGVDITSRSYTDQAWAITFIDTNTPAPVTGKLTEWRMYVSDSVYDRYIELQVFRPVVGGYQLVGENLYTVPLGLTGAVNYSVPLAQQIDVQAGDLLAFRYNGAIPYYVNRVVMFDTYRPVDYGWRWSYWPAPAHDVAIGGIIPSAQLTMDFYRLYSIDANIDPATNPPTHGSIAVPEPMSAGLAGAGLLALGLLVRRRR